MATPFGQLLAPSLRSLAQFSLQSAELIVGTKDRASLVIVTGHHTPNLPLPSTLLAAPAQAYQNLPAPSQLAPQASSGSYAAAAR
jgi:hypothetical protein